MSCKRVGNGFVCFDIGGYMEKEISFWQNNIEEYKKVFIEYMVRSSKCDKKLARVEVEAHIENVGITGIETPESDADECMEYWSADG